MSFSLNGSGEVFHNSTYVRQSDPLYPKMTTELRFICTCISLMKAFALPKYRHLRGILFLVFGMCGIAPCVHSTFFHGVEYSFSKEMFDQNLTNGLRSTKQRLVKY